MGEQDFRYYQGLGETAGKPPKKRPLPGFKRNERWTSPRFYIADQQLRDAVNVAILLGQPLLITGEPGTGKTHLSIALGVQAARRGHRVAFGSAQDWVGRLGEARRAGRLEDELERLRRIPLVIVDEVGYLSYSNRHADLLFELINRRYESASTVITSNRPFAEWPEVFPNAACVVSMVDRLLHHAEIIAIEGTSYRLKEAQERADQRSAQRRKAKSAGRKS